MAGKENLPTPEIPIGGKQPGALSWYFARALWGDADANHDGDLSKGEVQHFLSENVRMATESKQHPQVVPLGRTWEKLLTRDGHPGLSRLRGQTVGRMRM